jgi:hypothetical protein
MHKTLLYLSFSFVLFSTLSSAQYCINVGPSSTIDSNVESVVLAGASGSISHNGCPGVVGLQDMTALSVTLNAGGNYTAIIDFGTCGGNFAGAGQVWIDFDQSGTFDPMESLGTWTGTPPALPQNFNFNVPVGSQNGATRMRVMQQEAATLPLNPCATFTWGSVMDFTINIANGVDCSGYPGDDINDAIIISNLPYSDTNDNSYCYGNQNLVYNSPDVYYKINPSPMMESIHVSLCGSGFDTFLSVVDANGQIVAYNDDGSCGTQSELTFNTAGLGIVYVIVEGWGVASGEYIINIDGNYASSEQLDFSTIQLAPNPAGNHFSVQSFNGIVSIYSLSGNLVFESADYAGEVINTFDWSSGCYQVKLQNEQVTLNRKLIIE